MNTLSKLKQNFEYDSETDSAWDSDMEEDSIDIALYDFDEKLEDKGYDADIEEGILKVKRSEQECKSSQENVICHDYLSYESKVCRPPVEIIHAPADFNAIPSMTVEPEDVIYLSDDQSCNDGTRKRLNPDREADEDEAKQRQKKRKLEK